MIKTKKQVEQDIKKYGYTITLDGYTKANKKDSLEYIYYLDLTNSYIVIYDYEGETIKIIGSINQLDLVGHFRNNFKSVNIFQKYDYQQRKFSVIIIWE